MSDTHINAYYTDVDTKKQDLDRANAEYEAAKDRLDSKKKELGIEEPQKESKPSVHVKDEPKETKSYSVPNKNHKK